MNIKVLLPALIKNDEQAKMTDEAFNTLVSKDHKLDISVDQKEYNNAVAEVWNVFLDKWRGKKYDYLLITANDVEHDPNMIDYLVRSAEENKGAGIISCKVTRDKKDFLKNEGSYEYTSDLTSGTKDCASFLIRRGIIEKVGRIDEWFPKEFVERDFIYRCRLAGFDWIQPDIVLSFHPPYAGTIGNDEDRLKQALRKYTQKWGGDANYERFIRPFNDLGLDFTYCMK